MNRQELEAGGCRVVLNDCLDEMSRMGEGSVDVVVTSPPYNIGVPYGVHDDRLPRERYLSWMDSVFASIRQVVKPSGSFFLNVGSSSVCPNNASEVKAVAERHFKLQNHIVWVKSVSLPVDGSMRSFGHFKPVNSRRFLNNQFEDIYHFTHSGRVELDRLAVGVPYEDKTNITRWQSPKEDLRCAGNVWVITYETVTTSKAHPAGFPVGLPERCIRLHGVRDGMVVLDPFMGSGSTMVACSRLGVRGVGVDVDEGYLSVARERLDQQGLAVS